MVINVGVYDGNIYGADLTNEFESEYGIKYENNTFTFEEGKQKALQIVKRIDPTIEQFKLIHAADRDTTATYTYVPIINNVSVFYKPIEVTIRLDTGDVTRFDAYGMSTLN